MVLATPDDPVSVQGEWIPHPTPPESRLLRRVWFQWLEVLRAPTLLVQPSELQTSRSSSSNHTPSSEPHPPRPALLPPPSTPDRVQDEGVPFRDRTETDTLEPFNW